MYVEWLTVLFVQQFGDANFVSILTECFVFQIQFREKVLWTAITLFIFLVCCQVREIFYHFYCDVAICYMR